VDFLGVGNTNVTLSRAAQGDMPVFNYKPVPILVQDAAYSSRYESHQLSRVP